MPKLIIQNTKSQEEQEYDLPQDNILFGRTNTCDIELPQKSVSRRHAEISRIDQDYFISDLGSGNGTYLNQKRLRPEEKHLLRSGDILRIEDYNIRFFLTEGEEALEEDTDTDVLEIKLIKKMMKALDSEEIPSVEVLNGVAAGKRVNLPQDSTPFLIGRGEECHLPIQENVLSRNHVKLESKWGGVVITDLGSKNGTFVNNEPVQEKLLRDGDRIMLGTVKLLYRNPKEIRAQIAHQEAARKKKEAALQQAEALAKKQLEEEEKIQVEAREARERQAEEAEEVAEALAKEPPPAAPPVTAPLPPPPSAESKPRFGTAEKIMIATGIVVGIIAILVLAMLLM